MSDNKRKLYNALSQDYDLGSYEKFVNDIADEGKRKKLYEATKEEYDYGDYEKFSSQLGYPNSASPQVATTPTNQSEIPTTSVASTVQEASPSAEVTTQPTNVVEATKVSNVTNTQPTKVYKPVDYPWDDEQPTNDGVFYRASPQVQAQAQSQQTQSKVAPPPQGTTPVAQAPTTPVAQAPTTGKKSSGGGTQNDEFEESLEQLRLQLGESSLDNPWEYHKKWDEIRRGAYVKEVDEMLQSILDSDMPIDDADLVSLTSMFNGENSSQSIAAFNKYATPEQKERFQALEKWREQDALTEKKINAVIDQNPDLFLLLNPKGWDIDAVKRYIADQLVYGEYNNELLWYAGEGSEIPNQEQLAKYIISQELEIASRYGNAAHKAFMDNSFDSEATQQLFNAALWAEKNWGYATKVNFPEPFRRMYETYVGDAAERGELGTEEFEARVNDAFAKLDTYMGIMEAMSAEEREKYLPENWVEEIFTPYGATRSSEDKAAEYVASKNLLDDTGKFLTEAENLRREYMKKGRDEYAANTSATELAFDATVGSLESINPATNKFTSGNYKYSYEISLLDDITDMLEETEDLRKHKSRDDSFLSGLWHGFTDKATNFDTWDFGVDNFMEALTLKRLVEKSDRGESLTREEQMFLDAVATGMAAQYLIEPGRGYKAGMTTAEALPFMLEMIFSPIKGGSSAASKFARWAIKRYGLGGAKKLLPTTARYAIRGAGDIGKSVLTATTTGSFRTGQNALNRNIGEITPTTNDAGNVVYGGHEEGESTGKAITKAIGSTAIEYHSELVGEYFAPFLRGLSKLTDKGMSKIGLGSVTKFFKDVKSSDWAKLVGEMRKKASLQTTPGEFLEEIVGGIENAILVGEQTLDTEKDTGVFNTDNLIDTYLGVQVMGTMMTSVQSIGYKSESKRTELMRDNWSKQGEVLFGNNWGDIRAKIDGATMNDLSTIVTEIIADPKYSANQKNVVLRYAGAMAQDQALLSAEEQREMDYQGERVIDAQGWVDEGYNEGYDATSAESRRAVAEQDQDARKAVIDLLGLPEDAKVAEVMQQRYDSKNLRTISTKIINDSDLNRAQKDIMLNYVASQKRIQGMQKRHADEVEMAVDYFGAVVDGNSNKQTSQLVIGTLKDGEREVYIVDGEVMLLDDGTIDVANSTESLFVRDVDTGETESISAGELMGIEVQDPAEVKAQIAEDIKTRMQQEYDASFDAESTGGVEGTGGVGVQAPVGTGFESSPMEGKDNADDGKGEGIDATADAAETPMYRQGDEVRVVDSAGNELTGVVLEEENVDGEVLIEVGGRVLPIRREALDAMNSQSEAGSSAEVDSQESDGDTEAETDSQEIDDIEEGETLGDVFNTFTTKKGEVVEQRTKTKVRGGIRYTTIHSTINGNEVTVGNSYFPMPDGLEAIYIPEGVEVLGVKELREDVNSGAKSGTIVVRFEDGGLDTKESPLIMKQQEEGEEATDETDNIGGVDAEYSQNEEDETSDGESVLDGETGEDSQEDEDNSQQEGDSEGDTGAEDILGGEGDVEGSLSEEEASIPVDENGEPMYESAPVEATIADIYNDPDLDEEEADAFVQAKIDGATKRIADLEGRKPQMGESKVAFKEEKAKWREQLEAEQSSLAYWQGVQEVRAKESTTSPLQGTPPISQSETRGELDANGEMGEIGEISAEAEGAIDEDNGEGKKMSVEEARAKAEAERAAREKAREKAKAAGKRAEERARNRGDYRKAMAQWEDAPGSFYEYVAQALLVGDHKMRWNDVGTTRGLGRHTTGRRGTNRRGQSVVKKNEEAKMWAWLIDDYTGESPEVLADRLWNDYTGEYGEEMSEGMPLDVLLDVVTSMPTPRMMWDYVKGEHDARMEAERGEFEEQYTEAEIKAFERDAKFREEFGMSEEDYLANEDQWVEFIQNRQISVEELEEFDNFVAEQIIKENEQRNKQNAENEQRRDNRESEGGSDVLSGEQPDITRGNEDVAGESEGVDGNGVESNDVAQEEPKQPKQSIRNEPGVVKNSQLSRLPQEQVKLLDRVAKALGVQIEFVPTMRGANAKIEGNKVTVALDAEQIQRFGADGVTIVIGHELTHRIKALSNEVFEDFAHIIESILPEQFKQLMINTRIAYSRQGLNISYEALREEVVADLAGLIMTDGNLMEEFLKELEPKSTKQQILDILKQMFNALKGVFQGKTARDLANAERVLLESMKKASAVVNEDNTTEANNASEKLSIIGESGASALDRAEEVTQRMDNLESARKMEKYDYPKKAIRMATGWERGADGKWRYEIEDDFVFDIDGNVDYGKRNPQRLNDYKRYKELLHKKNALAFDGEELNAEEKAEFDDLAVIWKGTKLHNSTRLKDYIDHPELFEAYPELRDVSISFDNINARGEYDSSANEITLSNTLSPNEAKSTLIHEIQHAIQKIEGFARGGNVEASKNLIRERNNKALIWSFQKNISHMAKNNPGLSPLELIDKVLARRVELTGDNIATLEEQGAIPNEDGRIKAYNLWARGYDNEGYENAYNMVLGDDAFEVYRRHAGEVESRNVQSRMGMTPDQRRATLLAETEDVARKDQIFLMENSGVSAMASPFEYFTGTLVDLISIAKNAVKGLFKKIVTPVSSRLVGDLKELGIEISEEYKHVVDNYAIRHTFNNHGGKGEYLRGQIPINNSDFELIPDIVNNYDNITAIVTKKGLPGILYEKTFEDGTTVYVEEIHNKHKELALVSMRKIKRPTLLGANRTNEPTPIPSSGKSSADKGSDNIGDVQEDAKYSLRSNSQEVADIVAKAKADGTYMKAPNGEPTNLTEEQWANVRTKAFKDWFGDWENDSENASKVVDENGEPMVVYHGTESDFNVFDRTKGRASMDIQGMFFSPWELDAQGYGRNVRAFYLNIRKPSSGGQSYKALNRYQGQMYAGVKARDYLIGLGYDGVDNYGEEFIAFEPNQIKSATDNVGTYSNENDDTRYSLRGNTPFYSNAEYAVENIKQGKATPEQWLAMIQKNGGLKAGEDKWLGLSDWLKASDAKTLTKEEVLEFINQNKIVIEEVGYSQFGEGFIDEATKKLEAELKEVGWDEMENRYPGFGEYFEMYGNELVWSEEKAGIGEYEDFILDNEILTPDAQDNAINETRERYTTEGLENKKEIALVVPSVDPYNVHDEIHFGDAGGGRAVAWVRFGETADENGNRVLVIDEIQSKRHQDGREKGYRDAEMDKRAEEARKAYIEADKAFNQFREQLMEKYNYSSLVQGTAEERREGRKIWRSKFTPEEMTKYDQLHNKIIDTLAAHDNLPRQINRVPDAPFDKNWHELAMKRMLRYAAENGFDKVAWTTGAQQAERYDIGTLVNHVHVINSEEERYVSVSPNSGRIIEMPTKPNSDIITSGEYKGQRLQDVFGKELAEKILSVEIGNDVRIAGEDLRIGGEGMKGFYDKMLPSFMNKYGKKWGVKVGEVTMPELQDGYQTMHSIDVTDAMKESVMEGQPMFRDGSGALSDADLSYANDPFAKALGKSQRSKSKQAKFAERERKYMRNRVAELAEKMHLDNVEVVESSQLTPSPLTPQSHETPSPQGGTPPKQGSGGELVTPQSQATAPLKQGSTAGAISSRKARAKGWFDTRTGRIVINISNHTSVADVERTLLHEAVAHYGLRQLFGKQFDTFLDNVYRSAEADIRAQIVELAKKHGWDFRTATEEYLAGLAEDTNFEYLEYQTSFWQKIKQFFMDMLESIGWRYQGPELSDNELRYLLWRSYENMVNPGRHRSILGMAEDAVRRAKFGIGEYSADSPAPSQVAESGELYSDGDGIEAVNEQFNNELEENNESNGSNESTNAERDSDEGVLFRDGDVTVDDLGERDRVIARDAYERMMSQGRYQFTEAMQDSMMGLKLLYKAILGKKMRVEDIPDFENAYVAENLMSSQNAAEQHVYFVKFVKPLLDAVYKLAGSNAERRQQLTDYMMAKHGLERNQVMAERDAKRTADEAVKDIVEEDKKNVKWQEVYNEALKENRRRDYSGLTTLTGEENVAEAEYEAQKMVEKYEKAHGEDNITELWERVNAATKNTLEKLYRSGLMGKEQYEQTDAMYQYYIPLRGWEQTTSDEVYGYLTSKNGPMGSPIKHAKGRTSKADDPIATIGLMADDAIRHGNRNNMKQRFLNFVLNHPSDAVSVSELWLEYNEALDEWVPVFPNIDKDDSAEEIERKTQEFEARMEALANENPDKYKRGKDAANIPYKVVPGNEREHQVLVKRGGRTFVLTINGNPRAAQALNGLTNPDVKADSVVGPMLDWLQAGTRQLSALYTTRNPDFVVSNFLRDMIYSNSMVWIKESPKYAAKFHKNCIVAGTMLPILLTKWERGTLDMRKELEHNFFLFMINGGETGYTEIRDLEKHKRTVVAELKKKGNIGRKAWRALGIVADDANRSIENTARFAAFLTSRSEGRSVQRSAYDAKEISVNFNKKGAGGKFVKANGQTLLGKAGGYMSGYGRLFYAFWNAGMQGMTNFGKATKRHPFKATFAMALMYALGAWIASLNDDDDDDKDKYYLLPEYVRRSNICFRFGDGWVTIPLPIEFRAMYGLGELFTAVTSGNEKYTNEELAMAIAGQFSQLLPLDMLEGGGGLNAFTPTIIKPVVEAYRNVGWHGNPIHREFYGDAEKYDPQWTLAYSSTSTFLMDLTKALNEVGGGDNELPTRGNWWTDWNPARMEYMLKGYGGGVYSIVDKLIKSGETVFGDRPYEAKNTPMVNRIYKEDDPEAKQRKINGIFYKALEEAKETEDEVNKMEKKAESDSKYKAKLEAFKKSDEYKKYVFVIGYKDAIDEINKRLKYKDIEVPAEELDAQILMLKQELAEGIWSFETQTTSAIERQNELRELQIQEKYIDLDKKQQAAKDSIKIEEKKASGASAKEIHKTKSRAKGNLKRKDTDLKKAKKAFEEKYGEE